MGEYDPSEEPDFGTPEHDDFMLDWLDEARSESDLYLLSGWARARVEALRSTLETAERERDEARADRDAWKAKTEARPDISADVAQTWSFWRDERLAGSPPSCSAQLDEEMEAVDRVAVALRAHASKAVG